MSLYNIFNCLVICILSSFVVLVFAVAPEVAILDSQKPTVTFSEGASGAVICTATGVPAPTISWFWNGVLLSDDSVTFVITSSTDDSMSLLSVTSTLNVTSVMRDSAFATITCTASNGVGANSSDSTQLIVLCKLFVPNVVYECLLCMWSMRSGLISLVSPVAPIVTAISAKQVVTSPAPVSVNCTVDSYPPSNITWLHNGAEVQAAPPRVTISTVQVDNRTQESTLTLLNTTAEDIGTYTCSAVNGVGSINMTTELQVLGELTLLYFLDCILHFCSLVFAVAAEAAILASQKPTVTFSEGASGALMCTATGVPAPTISWFSDGVLLSDDGVTLVITSSTDDTMSLLSVTSTLNVTSVMRDSAFATITCTAFNGVDANSSDSTQLIVLCKLFVHNVVCICLLYVESEE